MANRVAMQRARALREQFRNRGTEFEHEEYCTALGSLLSDLRSDLYDDSVNAIAEKIDRESVQRSRDEEPCFPGFDLEGEYKSGDGRRIAKRCARLYHAQKALALAEANVLAVTEAAQELKEEIDKLLPYWSPDMDKLEAVNAYRAANP